MKVYVKTTHDQRDMLFIKLTDDEAHAIPPTIEFTVDDLPCLVSGVINLNDAGDELTPVIDELTFRRRPDGESLTSSMLRGIKLAEVGKAAINMSTIPYRREGNVYKPDLLSMGDETGRVGHLATARRGRSPDRADLENAVAAYRAAKDEGRSDRLAAVAEACFMSTATAGRRIKAARQAGMLEEDE